MPYLRGALIKEAIQNIATSEQCSGIRCYARKRAYELGSHYVGEAAQVIGTTIGAAAGSAVVSGVVGVGAAVIRSSSKYVLNPPKTYVGASLCVAGTLLTIQN